MPRFSAKNHLTLDDVQHVERELDVLSLDNAIDFQSVNPHLSCYFQTYGFDRMEANAQYFVGFLTHENYKVAAHYWRSDSSKPVVFVAHGLFDHVGLYLELVDRLLLAGYSVVAIDFPGHGLSEGEKAVIHDFAEYAEVIEHSLIALGELVQSEIYAVGQSTGGAALLNYVLEGRGERFSKIVLLAPLIQPRGWGRISIAHALLNYFIRFVPRNFTINSHSPEFCEFLKDYDPLQPRHISVKWIGAMKKWIRQFNSFEKSDIPTLVIQGDADMTVDWEKNLPRIQTQFTNCRIEMVEGAMHHLVNEGDDWREPVFKYVVDFLE